MVGLKFSFDVNDVEIVDGAFAIANTDSQNVALIALSQVCRLTAPEVGAQIPARIINVKTPNADAVFSDAMSQAKKDGAKNVFVGFDNDNNLIFKGSYGN